VDAANEGRDTWSPFQVLGHLTHVEESDWMDRTTTILASSEPTAFEPIDRGAGFARFEGWSITDLLEHFKVIDIEPRTTRGLVSVNDLERIGIHPLRGRHAESVTRGLVVHDLNHLDQIVKTMAKQYKDAIGPWREFLPSSTPRESVAATPLVAVESIQPAARANGPALEQVEDTSLQRRVAW